MSLTMPKQTPQQLAETIVANLSGARSSEHVRKAIIEAIAARDLEVLKDALPRDAKGDVFWPGKGFSPSCVASRIIDGQFLNPTVPANAETLVKLIKTEVAERDEGYKTWTLKPGDVVQCAQDELDWEGANVRKGTMGVVFALWNHYGDGAGPMVRWMNLGCCNVYPGDVTILK